LPSNSVWIFTVTRYFPDPPGKASLQVPLPAPAVKPSAPSRFDQPLEQLKSLKALYVAVVLFALKVSVPPPLDDSPEEDCWQDTTRDETAIISSTWMMRDLKFNGRTLCI
jgi:hypothetical protein